MKPQETADLANRVLALLDRTLPADAVRKLDMYASDLADLYEIAVHIRESVDRLLGAEEASERLNAITLLDQQLLFELPFHATQVARLTDRLAEYYGAQSTGSSIEDGEC